MSFILGPTDNGTKQFDSCPQGFYGQMKRKTGKPIIVLQQGYWLNGGLRQKEREHRGGLLQPS